MRYATKTDLRNELKFPPVFIAVGDYEEMLSESLEFVKKLSDINQIARVKVYICVA